MNHWNQFVRIGFWGTLILLMLAVTLAIWDSRPSRLAGLITQIIGFSISAEEMISDAHRVGNSAIACKVSHSIRRTGPEFCKVLGLKEASRTSRNSIAVEFSPIFEIESEDLESGYRFFIGTTDKVPGHYFKVASNATNTMLLISWY